jgi:hypothetical protein
VLYEQAYSLVDGQSSICNLFPADMLITNKTSNCLSTEEKEFDDNYFIDYVDM